MTTLKQLDITLIDLDTELVNAWRSRFDPHHYPRVHASQGSILTQHVDAIVSPANSFGFMDGGLDLALSMHFGWQLEDAVRDVLFAEHDGELPVGQAIVVPTSHEQVPWLVSAPTMRVPMNVSDTVNAYLAMRAILRAVARHNRTHPDAQIHTLACPGLGTGNGCMPSHRCAMQMAYAYDVCVLGHVLKKGGLAACSINHMDLIEHDRGFS